MVPFVFCSFDLNLLYGSSFASVQAVFYDHVLVEVEPTISLQVESCHIIETNGKAIAKLGSEFITTNLNSL